MPEPSSERLQASLRWLDLHINLEATAGEVEGLSLDKMARLMTALGEPQSDVPVIQVTGTNGKGSTAAMITSLLSSLGLTVGTYGSPHVSSVTERIQRNGEPIPEEELADVLEIVELAAASLDFSSSWFELMTAAAYRWFADIAADVAVVEVGKLGRFDATSVASPTVAVVTNVGYDHTDGADGWRRAVAWEKAGIIKPGSTLVLGVADDELDDLFLAENPVAIVRRGDDFDCTDNLLAVGGRQVALRGTLGAYDEVFVSLHGAHQGDNAAIALAAAETFVGAALSDSVVEEGFGTLALPGRFELLGHEPLVIVDGAHNPDGAEAAIATLDDGFDVAGRRFLVLGMMAERDPTWMLEVLQAERADLVICCQADSPRALPAEELAAAATAAGLSAEAVKDPVQALERALSLAADEDLVFVAGSLYIAGAVRDAYPLVIDLTDSA